MKNRNPIHSSALITLKLGGAQVFATEGSDSSYSETAYGTLLQKWLTATELLILLNDSTTTDTDHETASSQGIANKPKDGFFDLHNQFKLILRDVELLASRLLKIKHILESEIEHDPAMLRDLIKLAKRLSRNLTSIERKFSATSKEFTPSREHVEQLNDALRTNAEVEKLINLPHQPSFYPAPKR